MKILSINNKKITFKKINKDFLKFNSWENKYQYIIKLSNFLIEMPQNMKNNKNLIYGCKNKIWCNVYSNNKLIILYGYSDSLIIKGIISIIFILLNNFNAKKINELNLNKCIRKFNFIKDFLDISYNIINIEKFIKFKINKLIIK